MENELSQWLAAEILDHTARSVNPQCWVTTRHALKDDKITNIITEKKATDYWMVRGYIFVCIELQVQFVDLWLVFIAVRLYLHGIEKRKVYWRITYQYKHLQDDSREFRVQIQGSM